MPEELAQGQGGRARRSAASPSRTLILQQQLAPQGWFRWGSTWVDQKQLDELKVAEKEISDSIAAARAGVRGEQAAHRGRSSSTIRSNEREMQEIESRCVVRDRDGRLRYFTRCRRRTTTCSARTVNLRDRAAEPAGALRPAARPGAAHAAAASRRRNSRACSRLWASRARRCYRARGTAATIARRWRTRRGREACTQPHIRSRHGTPHCAARGGASTRFTFTVHRHVRRDCASGHVTCWDCGWSSMRIDLDRFLDARRVQA